ncbi:MAG: Na-K-Cl cotransporter [Acidobacteria bacterium]|nr:MAG: Na-K-Cl cotransporter [Acidobacteriota bacterium]REK03887.1 MAG: Na-K-Cl cotransporter [Acidobacteriota bacterium]
MTSGTAHRTIDHAPGAPRRKLGTFLGVFTPSLLTILGVVLFIRTGWVVGNVGLLPALAIVLLAHSITIATALSVSAIATNMQVGVGGAYFMISRSLGLEIGGAIGVPLFLAQTFSLTLYSFGFAEGLRLFWPDAPLRTVAACTVLAVALVAGRSTNLALRMQIPILIAIAAALASLVVGALDGTPASPPLWSGGEAAAPFWVVFAVFFPAVTGLMAGVSLSGDLADPARSIPRGTLAAVLVGMGVYLTVPIVLAAATDAETLMTDNLVWFGVAAVPWLIHPALFGAILSSALGSVLGAPRTLEKLIDDRVLPRLPGRLARSRWATRLPHLLATAVALAAVALGDLNAVAPVLTMFFLTTYAVINLVAGIERLVGSPSYRPAVQVPWVVSLAGAAGCVWVMFLIHPLAALIAIVLEIGLYLGLRRRSMSAAWGDLRYGALMSLTRALLLKLRDLPMDPRNWRPHILVFAGDLERRMDLVRIAAWLNQGRGILTVSKVLIGDFERQSARVAEELDEMSRLLHHNELVAFPEVDIAENLEQGVLQVVQANGIAGLTSNTLMLGWSTQPGRMATHLRIARQAARLGKSTILCRLAPRTWSTDLRRIDVWWGGLQNNGDMLLLLAYLVTANRVWSKARIHVKTITTSTMTHDQTERGLQKLLERTRIHAEPVVFQRPQGETVQDVIHRESRHADLVLMGLQEVEPGAEDLYAQRLTTLVGDLPTVILVHAAGPFAGRLLQRSGEES